MKISNAQLIANRAAIVAQLNNNKVHDILQGSIFVNDPEGWLAASLDVNESSGFVNLRVWFEDTRELESVAFDFRYETGTVKPAEEGISNTELVELIRRTSDEEVLEGFAADSEVILKVKEFLTKVCGMTIKGADSITVYGHPEKPEDGGKATYKVWRLPTKGI